MRPSDADIARALDLIDWMPLAHVLEIRAHISRAIRGMLNATLGVELVTSSNPTEAREPWDALDAALLYVFWTTSDEYLAARMKASPGTVH